MSDLFESIKQGASEVLSSIDQQGHIKSAIQGLRSQWTEVERRRRINQLEAQVKTMQIEMKQLTEALGLQVLSLHDAGRISHPELTRLCERIGELRSEIGERRAELNDLKAVTTPAATKCPKCQAEVEAGAEYCPKCGSRVKTEEPAATSTSTSAQTTVRLRCPKCKAIVPEGSGFCPTCGVKLKMPQKAPSEKHFCASCGAQVAPGARFCPVCGQSVDTAS